MRLGDDIGADIVATSASGNVLIGNHTYSGPAKNIKTHFGPTDKVLTVHTKSVSGQVSILQREDATH